jgi:hypothetical protein
VLPETSVILGATCSVIGSELTQNGNVEGATRSWCTHHGLSDVWHFGELNAAASATSAQGSGEAGLNGAIPCIFMRAQLPFRL